MLHAKDLFNYQSIEEWKCIFHFKKRIQFQREMDIDLLAFSNCKTWYLVFQSNITQLIDALVFLGWVINFPPLKW